jgi:hypothetical protein
MAHIRRITASAVPLVLAASLLAVPAAADESAPAAPGTTAPAPAPAFRNSCDPARAALPGSVAGAPSALVTTPFAPRSMAKALYVWHDAKGWHMRLTHDEAPTTAADATTKPTLVEVRGRITASRPLVRVRTVRLEDRQRGEWVSVKRPGRRTMDFRFVNGGHVDGIDFAAGCAGRLTFTAWQVTRDDAGKVVGRMPVPVLFGTGMTPAAGPSPAANPGLGTPPADATRVVVLRTPTAA